MQPITNQDQELERNILGAILIESKAIEEVADILTPQTFYHPKLTIVYQVCLQLFSSNEPIDILTVTEQLRHIGKLEEVGGPAFVVNLTTRVNSSTNLVYHARILQQYYLKRKAGEVGRMLLNLSQQPEKDCFELLDDGEQQLFELRQGLEKRGFVDAGTVLSNTLTELEEAAKKPDGLTGVPTPFDAFNKLFGGWQKTDFILIGARPAMGKTAMGLQLALYPALQGIPTGVVELEMSNNQLMKRLISMQTGIYGHKLRKGELTGRDWQILMQETVGLSKAPLYLDDTPAQTPTELRAKARRLKNQHGIELLLVDYLQLMRPAGKIARSGNRENEITQISQSCKQLAKDLNIPVIALAQLSRAVETRGGDKRPQLSDLRDSGSLEQDADIVSFLWRPEYYGINELEDGTPTEGYAEYMVAKHRNGSLEDIPLTWEPKLTRFSNYQPLINQPAGFSPALDFDGVIWGSLQSYTMKEIEVHPLIAYFRLKHSCMKQQEEQEEKTKLQLNNVVPLLEAIDECIDEAIEKTEENNVEVWDKICTTIELLNGIAVDNKCFVIN